MRRDTTAELDFVLVLTTFTRKPKIDKDRLCNAILQAHKNCRSNFQEQRKQFQHGESVEVSTKAIEFNQMIKTTNFMSV